MSDSPIMETESKLHATIDRLQAANKQLTAELSVSTSSLEVLQGEVERLRGALEEIVDLSSLEDSQWEDRGEVAEALDACGEAAADALSEGANLR